MGEIWGRRICLRTSSEAGGARPVDVGSFFVAFPSLVVFSLNGTPGPADLLFFLLTFMPKPSSGVFPPLHYPSLVQDQCGVTTIPTFSCFIRALFHIFPPIPLNLRWVRVRPTAVQGEEDATALKRRKEPSSIEVGYPFCTSTISHIPGYQHGDG